MTKPSFDSVEAQASYGIGLQVGQQLQESGLEGLQPEALLAGLTDALNGNAPSVPVEAVTVLCVKFMSVQIKYVVKNR